MAYLKGLDAPAYLLGYISFSKGRKFTSLEAWQMFLANQNITNKTEMRLVTEAALCASIIENGIPRDLGIHGDDAGQFDAFIRSLCWIHEERHYRKIVPANEQARADLEQVRNEIWTIYRELKIYQQSPAYSDLSDQSFQSYRSLSDGIPMTPSFPFRCHFRCLADGKFASSPG